MQTERSAFLRLVLKYRHFGPRNQHCGSHKWKANSRFWESHRMQQNFTMISQLDQQYAAEMKDIIIAPPHENKFLKLKTELIKRLSASQEKKLKQLLMHEELGDRKPSQFLRHLQTLAGPAVPDSFLRTLWSSRLPHNVQTIIASQADTPLEAAADLADRVYEIVPTPAAHVVASTDNSISMTDVMHQLAELSREVASLREQVTRSREYGRSNSRDSGQQNRQHGRSRSRPRQQNPDFCWYHNRFGKRATRCTTPCKFVVQGNANGSRK
ncbi:uncharacterized protein [Battus philenor]|uniref:uncharacterized protein n=1 Tax=Battus philenor TaxID=42288 RepID=UPI0035CF21F1